MIKSNQGLYSPNCLIHFSYSLFELKTNKVCIFELMDMSLWLLLICSFWSVTALANGVWQK